MGEHTSEADSNQRNKEIIAEEIWSDVSAEEIWSDVRNDKGLMRITLDYLQMDMVDTVEKWIQSKDEEEFKLFDHKRDSLFEPWLRWVAKHDQVVYLLYLKDIPETYVWFTATEAAKSNNKKLVLGLINERNPQSAVIGCVDATKVVIYSWLYIVWRFLVKNDEKIRHEKQWQDVAFREYGEYSSGDGWTFLHFAAAWGDVECVEELLKEDTNMVNAKTNRNRYTPLHLAAYHGNATIVKSLLTQKSNAAEETDSKRRTPLHHASERGCLDSVKALLDHKDTFNVDAVDENGMTALHLAACRGHTAVVSELLKSESAGHHVQCSDMNDLVMAQKLFILQERKEKVWLSKPFYNPEAELESCYAANAVFLEPNQLLSEVWCPGGFNALHFAVVYGDNDTVREILKHAKNKEGLPLWAAAKDRLGLTPVDWAKAMEVVQAPEDSKTDLLGKDSKSSLLAKDGLISINFDKAKTHWHEIREAEQERRKTQWAIDLSEAILTRRWAVARCITSLGVTDQIRIDDAVWEHLEKAICEVFKFGRTQGYRKCLIESMLVELVNGGALSKSSSIMQRCLKWAIKQEMVDLVKDIVRNTKEAGDLLGAGTKAGQKAGQESPLEAASKIKGSRGQEIVAAIEEQTDVKRLLLEDRQVYVEYSNTILVGAVLVAALAFQGWVQTPQGYAGMPLDSSSKGMLLFARCNSLGFFFAMGAFMAGAVGAMPPKSGEFVRYRDKVIRAASVASLLMAVAVACQVVGFASALVSIQSSARGNEDMLLSSRFGTIIIFILSGWFLSRLNNVQNVVSLLLEALPRTFLHILMAIFSFWSQFADSRTFRRYILCPFYTCALIPLLRSSPWEYLKKNCPTSQFTLPFKSKLLNRLDSVNKWFQKQEDIYDGNVELFPSELRQQSDQ